jgi:hypothetical protein
LEVSFTAASSITHCIEVWIDEVQFGGELINLIVEVAVSDNLPADAPIPSVSSNTTKELELISGSNEEVSKPHGDGECWEWIGIFFIFKVGLGIEVGNVGLVVRPLGVSISGHYSIRVEFDPLHRAVKVRTDQNAEVRNMVWVDSVPVMLQWAYYLLLWLDTLLIPKRNTAVLKSWSGSALLTLTVPPDPVWSKECVPKCLIF